MVAIFSFRLSITPKPDRELIHYKTANLPQKFKHQWTCRPTLIMDWLPIVMYTRQIVDTGAGGDIVIEEALSRLSGRKTCLRRANLIIGCRSEDYSSSRT